jgi:hypothetical protein
MTSFAPVPDDLPDGLYRARLDGAIDTLWFKGGQWRTRTGYPVSAPEEYAPLDRRVA